MLGKNRERDEEMQGDKGREGVKRGTEGRMEGAKARERGRGKKEG
jgi:hypothetical protein